MLSDVQSTLAAQWSAVVEQLQDGFVLFDHAGRCLYANPRAQELAGDVAEPEPWSLFGLGDDETAEALRVAEAEQRVLRREELHDRLGRWLEIEAYPTPAGLSVFLRDVSERKRLEVETEELNHTLETVIQTSPLAIIAVDLRGTVKLWNPAARRMFGFGEEEVIDLPIPTIPPGEEGRFAELLADYARGKSTIGVDARRRHKDGRVMDVAVYAAPLRNDAGQIVGALGLFADVTERKQMEAVIAERTQDLERSNEELQQFAYVASHDLKEPLRMIASYGQLLQRKYGHVLDQDGQEFIGFMVSNVKRMDGLIQDLLAYARVLNAETNPLRPTPVAGIVQWALANLQLTIEETGAVITQDALPTVMTDSVLLVQVFQNLIGNALKYRREEPPRIQVSAEQQGDDWVIAIRDNGLGIETEYREQIFGVFKRLHGSKYPGAGIGLAICKNIVGRHGGRIWVESEPGVGSTFFFTVPAAAANSAAG